MALYNPLRYNASPDVGILPSRRRISQTQAQASAKVGDIAFITKEGYQWLRNAFDPHVPTNPPRLADHAWKGLQIWNWPTYAFPEHQAVTEVVSGCPWRELFSGQQRRRCDSKSPSWSNVTPHFCVLIRAPMLEASSRSGSPKGRVACQCWCRAKTIFGTELAWAPTTTISLIGSQLLR